MVEAGVDRAGRTRSRRPWLRIFLSGLGLWVATAVVIFATGNPNLIPTLVLLGSFLMHFGRYRWEIRRFLATFAGTRSSMTASWSAPSQLGPGSGSSPNRLARRKLLLA